MHTLFVVRIEYVNPSFGQVQNVKSMHIGFNLTTYFTLLKKFQDRLNA